MKKQILISLAAAMLLGGVLVAEEAATAEAKEAPAAVAKNDAPGSLKGGNALLSEGKFEEAVAYFEGIGEQSSTKREPYRLIGLSTALVELGKYAEAIDAAQKALAISPALSAAWNNLAAAYARNGERAKAVETYKEAIEKVKSKEGDTSKLEKNLADIETAIEAGKPKKVKEAEAKAKELGSQAKEEAEKK